MAQYYRWVKENQKAESEMYLKNGPPQRLNIRYKPQKLNTVWSQETPLESHADQAGEGVDPMELTKLMVRKKRLTWSVVKVTPSESAIF